MKKSADIYIGTSGWHYNHWFHIFYPPEIEGYEELRFYADHFDTVENNSSFYRIAKESTYKTWLKKTPPHFKFSLKLNKLITHIHRLELNDETKENALYILQSTQVLGERLGAIVIQLPASFRLDLPKLRKFLTFFTKEARKLRFPPDIAIEFRNKYWFDEKVYELLRKYNVALVAAQSSRYPGAREVTADFLYIRLHGPEKLFASKYSKEHLAEWAKFIQTTSKKVRRAYVYFNNDFHGYALENARELFGLLQ